MMISTEDLRQTGKKAPAKGRLADKQKAQNFRHILRKRGEKKTASKGKGK